VTIYFILLFFGGIPHAKPSQAINVGDVSLTILYVHSNSIRSKKIKGKEKAKTYKNLKTLDYSENLRRFFP